MQKNKIENVQSATPSLEEMIKITGENNKYNSFIYFKQTSAVFHISRALMWQIWIRLSEGPWRPIENKELQRDLDGDQTIRNDISFFLNNYIYNWQGDKFHINFAKNQLNKIRQIIVDTFTYSLRFSNYIDKVMSNTNMQTTLSFKLSIKTSLFEIMNIYELIPLSTIYPTL